MSFILASGISYLHLPSAPRSQPVAILIALASFFSSSILRATERLSIRAVRSSALSAAAAPRSPAREKRILSLLLRASLKARLRSASLFSSYSKIETPAFFNASFTSFLVVVGTTAAENSSKLTGRSNLVSKYMAGCSSLIALIISFKRFVSASEKSTLYSFFKYACGSLVIAASESLSMP